jgi:hypothetical protein
MTTPRLATTRPAALTGRVGQGGENRIHDVALVQALLGLKRAKNGRMYLRDNHVTGKLDRDTTLALMQFRLDQGDKNVKSPLARTGPIFNKLAQGQALAVLEDTALPYKLTTLAEPGEAKGEAAKLLSAERKVELKAVMKDFISEWGIALDVEIKVATNDLPARTSNVLIDFESLPLVAHFTARNLWVHNGRNLSNLSNSVQFQARAKVLHEAAAADLKSRGADAFGITDPVDVKIQNGLKDQLASVVRTDLEGVEALMQFLLAKGRKEGFTLAVRFLENYLKADGAAIELDLGDSPEFNLGRNGAAENVERFKQKSLISPDSSKKYFAAIDDISKKSDVIVTQFEDHWKYDLDYSLTGIGRFLEAGFDEPDATFSTFLATGRSSVTSTGDFLLQREGDRISVAGSVTHIWSDVDGYNFNAGAFFRPESQVLERHKKAKPFKWTVKWEEGILGELQIDNAFSPNAARRWIRFETNPIASNLTMAVEI